MVDSVGKDRMYDSCVSSRFSRWLCNSCVSSRSSRWLCTQNVLFHEIPSEMMRGQDWNIKYRVCMYFAVRRLLRLRWHINVYYGTILWYSYLSSANAPWEANTVHARKANFVRITPATIPPSRNSWNSNFDFILDIHEHCSKLLRHKCVSYFVEISTILSITRGVYIAISSDKNSYSYKKIDKNVPKQSDIIHTGFRFAWMR